MPIDEFDEFDDLLGHTLDDYLLALAQGIQEAQRQLDQLAVPGQPGQPTTAYHLPRVDFELKMTFAMQGERADAKAPANGRAPARSSKLLMRPAGRAAGETYSGEATSVIRGSFVAVPVAGGRGPSRLRCALIRKSPYAIGLSVTITDGLGVGQADVPVQINVDRERSAELSSPPGRALDEGTEVKLGVLRTDASGYAETTLHIAESEPTGTVVVVIIDGGGATETVMIPVTNSHLVM